MDDLFEFHDELFRRFVIFGPELEQIYSGMQFGEGPVYFGDLDLLIWSDIPNNRLMRYVGGQVSVFRSPSNHANGNTRDREGRLLTCEQGARRVTRTERDGSITVIADSFRGRKLNSPNDVVVKSDDSIWFSDPTYGISNDWEGVKAPREQDVCRIYRVDPTDGSISAVVEDCEMPNGLAFSLDEQRLYVTDTGISESPTGAHHLRVYDVVDGKRLANGRGFAEVNPGCPDGFRLDEEGFIWTSAGDGVQCFSPDGQLIGRVRVPETVTNLTFGGPQRNRLFMTGAKSLWSLYVNRRGAPNR